MRSASWREHRGCSALESEFFYMHEISILDRFINRAASKKLIGVGVYIPLFIFSPTEFSFSKLEVDLKRNSLGRAWAHEFTPSPINALATILFVNIVTVITKDLQLDNWPSGHVHISFVREPTYLILPSWMTRHETSSHSEMLHRNVVFKLPQAN